MTARYASGVDVHSFRVFELTTILRGFVEKIIQLNYLFKFIIEVGVIYYISSIHNTWWDDFLFLICSIDH